MPNKRGESAMALTQQQSDILMALNGIILSPDQPHDIFGDGFEFHITSREDPRGIIYELKGSIHLIDIKEIDPLGIAIRAALLHENHNIPDLFWENKEYPQRLFLVGKKAILYQIVVIETRELRIITQAVSKSQTQQSGSVTGRSAHTQRSYNPKWRNQSRNYQPMYDLQTSRWI